MSRHRQWGVSSGLPEQTASTVAASDPTVWLLLLPTLVYAGSIVTIAIWRRRAGAAAPRSSDGGELPRIGILVAARNEERNIGRCIEALLAQEYPPDRLSIYVADDQSTDRTAAIIQQYQDSAQPRTAPAIAGTPTGESAPVMPRLRLVRVSEPRGQLRAKALAVHTAIEQSDEEILLMTDADCAPPPRWAEAMVEYFQDERIGVITAGTEIDTASNGHRLLTRVQALDWRYLLTASSFLVEIGRPVTAMGNNMAFRRAAYEAVGGYPALPFSVTEDYLLFRRIVEETPYEPRFPIDSRLLNITRPLDRLRDVVAQRRRWARGGLRAPASVYGIYGLAHLAHVLPLVVLFVASIPALFAIAAKCAADLVLLRSASSGTGVGQLRAFPAWQIYFYAYVCLLPVAVLLFPGIRWKGRKL
jgi:1,2-diacylglycerol 3-beta-glucosyltransferase